MKKPEAKKLLTARCPGWTDPGGTLLHYVKRNADPKYRTECIEAARVIGEEIFQPAPEPDPVSEV